jgi:hypothetical protein
MLQNLAKYAAVAAVAGGLGIAATGPASAWGGYGYYRHHHYGYYRHHYYGYYRPFYRHHRHYWW